MQGMQRYGSASGTGDGRAQETHFGPRYFGSAAQQSAQQDAVRSLHGSSRRQETHHDGRTIRSASRPSIDNALAARLCTRDIVLTPEECDF